MRAIMVMFDSLKRDYLPNYGCDFMALPNFKRLEQHAVRFDNFYAGSMPCMPARREIHSGRYNFLHRGWGPLEPFDDSMPELLKQNGIHTHLVSDHYHYWMDGGSNYHSKYSTWENIRGQEGDYWQADLTTDPDICTLSELNGRGSNSLFDQDKINRLYMNSEEMHPQNRTFKAGLSFLERNAGAQDWFLQIECFDPHEPFFALPEYQEKYKEITDRYEGGHIDWPQSGPVMESDELAEYIRCQYQALLDQCDQNLGKVLDLMDHENMWEDTMLIVNTDHGLLIGERNWWSKNVMPYYNEIINLPFFFYDPRVKTNETSCDKLAQTIDICPTLLDFFGVAIPESVQGKPLPLALAGETIHPYVLFGLHGAHINITDGRYVYMRAPISPDNAPLYEYTLIPTRTHERISTRYFQDVTLADAFDFTKGCKTMKLDLSGDNNPNLNVFRYGSRLYDLSEDPGQTNLVDNPEQELLMIREMASLMRANDAPKEQYQRVGIPDEGIMTETELFTQREAVKEHILANPLPEFTWSPAASSQFKTLLAILNDDTITEAFRRYIKDHDITKVMPEHIYDFAGGFVDSDYLAKVMFFLKQSERFD